MRRARKLEVAHQRSVNAALKMSRLKESWSLRRIDKARAKTRAVTEPHLPQPFGCLDSDPTRVNFASIDIAPAETARTEIDFSHACILARHQLGIVPLSARTSPAR
jgi:hypothetical protein